MTNLQNDVLDIIATKGMVARDGLTLDKSLTELNISSLDVVEIVFALEDKFNIEIPFNANQSAENKLEFNTVGEVVAAVEKLVKSKAA
jgi:acyl carrier protein